MIRNGGRIQGSLCVIPVLWVVVSASAAAQNSDEQALEAVREQIQTLEERLARQHVERHAGNRALRAVEQFLMSLWGGERLKNYTLTVLATVMNLFLNTVSVCLKTKNIICRTIV